MRQVKLNYYAMIHRRCVHCVHKVGWSGIATEWLVIDIYMTDGRTLLRRGAVS